MKPCGSESVSGAHASGPLRVIGFFRIACSDGRTVKAALASGLALSLLAMPGDAFAPFERWMFDPFDMQDRSSTAPAGSEHASAATGPSSRDEMAGATDLAFAAEAALLWRADSDVAAADAWSSDPWSSLASLGSWAADEISDPQAYVEIRGIRFAGLQIGPSQGLRAVRAAASRGNGRVGTASSASASSHRPLLSLPATGSRSLPRRTIADSAGDGGPEESIDPGRSSAPVAGEAESGAGIDPGSLLADRADNDGNQAGADPNPTGATPGAEEVNGPLAVAGAEDGPSQPRPAPGGSTPAPDVLDADVLAREMDDEVFQHLALAPDAIPEERSRLGDDGSSDATTGVPDGPLAAAAAVPTPATLSLLIAALPLLVGFTSCRKRA